LYLS
jgi:hypothetical protein